MYVVALEIGKHKMRSLKFSPKSKSLEYKEKPLSEDIKHNLMEAIKFFNINEKDKVLCALACEGLSKIVKITERNEDILEEILISEIEFFIPHPEKFNIDFEMLDSSTGTFLISILNKKVVEAVKSIFRERKINLKILTTKEVGLLNLGFYIKNNFHSKNLILIDNTDEPISYVAFLKDIPLALGHVNPEKKCDVSLLEILKLELGETFMEKADVILTDKGKKKIGKIEELYKNVYNGSTIQKDENLKNLKYGALYGLILQEIGW